MPATPPQIQRQIRLPTSKAVEIAWKSIRLRLSRSLLVTSGIVLALAFLISISAGEALTEGMRQWIAASQESSEFAELRQRRGELEQALRPIATRLREAAGAAPAASFDERPLLGETFEEARARLGDLPAPPEALRAALAADAGVATPLREWLSLGGELHGAREALTAPQQLQSMMQARGVPSTPQEIADSRLQTRWLLGLALLVAFVGILNAMLMSVTERFREIGTMKCLGALDSFIIKLFLIESLFQGVAGTLIGLVLGLALTFVAALINYGRFAVINLQWDQIGLAALTTLLVGVGLTVAGAVYPAWTAARMQPVDAMRAEV